VDMCPRHVVATSRSRASSQSRIDRFALQRKHSKYTLVNSAQWFLVNETLQRLQSKGKLPKRERPLCARPLLFSRIKFSELYSGHR